MSEAAASQAVDVLVVGGGSAALCAAIAARRIGASVRMVEQAPATLRGGYIPLINGSDTNFSHPFVLTYPGNGFPTDKPRPQLFVNNLTGFSHGIGTPIGSVNDTQLWGADFGVLR